MSSSVAAHPWPGGQRLDVVAQQRVQERRAVAAGDLEHAEVARSTSADAPRARPTVLRPRNRSRRKSTRSLYRERRGHGHSTARARLRARATAGRAPPIRRFQRRLLAWYARHGRDLPWRRTRVTLPRARLRDHAAADAGGPRDPEVSRSSSDAFPRCAALAAAPRRGRAAALVPAGLQRPPAAPARDRVRDGGALRRPAPRRRRARSAALPGIGRYTAGAVLSFAFGRDVAVLDTNVRRVLTRVFLGPRRTARLRGDERCGSWPSRWCRPAAATTSTRR